MSGQEPKRAIAFAGPTRIAAGTLRDVIAKAKRALDDGEWGAVLIFDDQTGERIDVDFRGSLEDIVEHMRLVAESSTPRQENASATRGPGRPRLGVVAREVTLLPRHWEWLNRQPGGASVALRRLVDDARAAYGGRDIVRQAREAAYRFMSAMAGDETGFEEATRALFAGNAERFIEFSEAWPPDVRDHARVLAERSFKATEAQVPSAESA